MGHGRLGSTHVVLAIAPLLGAVAARVISSGITGPWIATSPGCAFSTSWVQLLSWSIGLGSLLVAIDVLLPDGIPGRSSLGWSVLRCQLACVFAMGCLLASQCPRELAAGATWPIAIQEVSLRSRNLVRLWCSGAFNAIGFVVLLGLSPGVLIVARPLRLPASLLVVCLGALLCSRLLMNQRALKDVAFSVSYVLAMGCLWSLTHRLATKNRPDGTGASSAVTTPDTEKTGLNENRPADFGVS